MIITDAGICDSYRYGLVVSRGRIHYDGDSNVMISGDVDPLGPRQPALRSIGRAGQRRFSRSDGEGLVVSRRRIHYDGDSNVVTERVVGLALLGPLASGAARSHASGAS